MSEPSPGRAEGEAARVFAALGDPTRLSLLSRLSGGETHSISRLSADTRLTRQAITKHLHVLELAGLVRSARVGRESRYAYQPEAVVEARTCLDAISAQWDAALSRLRDFVER